MLSDCVSGALIFHEDGTAELLRNGSTVLDNRVIETSRTTTDSTFLSGNAQTVLSSSKSLLTTSTTSLSQISSKTLYKSSTTPISQIDSAAVTSDSSSCLSGQYISTKPVSHTSATLSSSIEVTAPGDMNSDITEDSEEEEVLFPYINRLIPNPYTCVRLRPLYYK